MKKLLLILSLFCLSCDKKITEANERYYKEKETTTSFMYNTDHYCNSFLYFKDLNTDLCFASYGCDSSEGNPSITNVPCESLSSVNVHEFKSSEPK